MSSDLKKKSVFFLFEFSSLYLKIRLYYSNAIYLIPYAWRTKMNKSIYKNKYCHLKKRDGPINDFMICCLYEGMKTWKKRNNNNINSTHITITIQIITYSNFNIINKCIHVYCFIGLLSPPACGFFYTVSHWNPNRNIEFFCLRQILSPLNSITNRKFRKKSSEFIELYFKRSKSKYTHTQNL